MARTSFDTVTTGMSVVCTRLQYDFAHADIADAVIQSRRWNCFFA
jgi:hypothetical protein